MAGISICRTRGKRYLPMLFWQMVILVLLATNPNRLIQQKKASIACTRLMLPWRAEQARYLTRKKPSRSTTLKLLDQSVFDGAKARGPVFALCSDEECVPCYGQAVRKTSWLDKGISEPAASVPPASRYLIQSYRIPLYSPIYSQSYSPTLFFCSTCSAR